jgi:hypothetical protein
VGTLVEEPIASKSTPAANSDVGQSVAVDAQEVLLQVLQLTQESMPGLDVDAQMRDAIAHPDTEVVDSLGAVSIVCMLYGAYSPENLIPAHLLTHRNLTTLNGLKKVITELNKRQVKP